MQIQGLNIFSYKPQKSVIGNNQYDYSRNKYFIAQNDCFVKQNPDISFTGIRSASDYRNLVNRRVIHCIYCGRPFPSTKLANKLKSNGTFSGPIINFTKEMINHIDTLHKTEKEVLKKITLMAFDEPNIKLSTAIKKLYPEANKELLKEQIPIFKELSALANEIPRGWKTKYQNVLKITKYRLADKEYIPPEFSGKEFAYKINRLSETINDEYMAARIMKLTEPLTHPIFKNAKEPLTDKFIDKIFKLTETRGIYENNISKKDLQHLLLLQIRKHAEILKRKDIINLCDIGSATLEKQPVKIKYSNKTFRYDLNEALENMPDKALKARIISIVKRLPTSQTSVNAFIAKHENSASDAIGYDMLRPSFVTIEHTHPKSQNGANELWNYVLACSRDNNKRSDMDLKEFIKDYDRKNQQQFFNEIFEEIATDNLPKETAIRMFKNFCKESGLELEMPMIKEKQQVFKFSKRKH